jgi:hypothetical protein
MAFNADFSVKAHMPQACEAQRAETKKAPVTNMKVPRP